MGKIYDFFIANENNNYHPGFINFKVILVVAFALSLTRLFLVFPEVQSSAVESVTLMNLVNKERTQRNLTSLLTHTSLMKAAAVKSQDMIDRGYFAHKNPDGNYIWGEIVSSGYGPYKILGENLAIDFSTSEGLVQAWIDSPTHRENLLNPDFVHQGLSALYGDYQGRFTNLTTNLFGTLQLSTAAPPPPAPPPPLPPVASETTTAPEEPSAPEPAQTTEPEPAVETPEPPLETPDAGVREKPQEDKGAGFDFSLDAPEPTNTFPTVNIVRLVFTIFGIGFLLVLTVDSYIIYRNEKKISRGQPSYHLFIFLLLVLVSVLVWWWS